MNSMNTAVENYFNLNDTTAFWYDIPGYPGYQLGKLFDGSVCIRSFKKYKQFPYGNLIKPTNNIIDGRHTFILTNSNNKRVELSVTKLLELSEKSIPVPSYIVIDKGRNNRIGILPEQEDNNGKVIKNPTPIRCDKQTLSFPDFSKLK